MKTLTILAASALLAACAGTGTQCERIGLIATAPAPTDVPETAANRFDTEATVRRVDLHNRAVSQVCGVLPAPQ